MEVIIVVYLPTRDSSVEQVGVEPTNGNSPKRTDLSIEETHSGPYSPTRNKLIPPFWTWFVENPRGCGMA
jgi:hypothetical protein